MYNFRVSTFGILELYQYTPAPSSSRNFTALGSQVLPSRSADGSLLCDCVTGSFRQPQNGRRRHQTSPQRLVIIMADSSNSAGSTASAARYGGHDRFTLELEVSLFAGNAYHG